MKDRYRGIMFSILTSMFFAGTGMFVRLAGPNIPSMQKCFFRNLIALIFAVAIIIRKKERFMPERRNLALVLGRALFGTVGVLCNFYAVDHLVISDASLLNKMSTFYLIIFSFLFLHEKVKLYQAVSVLIAFIGALFVIKPSFSNSDLGAALIGFIGGIGAGSAYTCIRALGKRGEQKSLIVFWFSLISTLISIPLFAWRYVPMSGYETGMLICAGLTACGGQFSITNAYRYAPARELGIYDYTQIIFSALIGYFVFSEMPDVWSILGYVMIIGTAFVMFRLDNRKEKIA